MPTPFRFFPIEGYGQVTSKWIDPNQKGYSDPMMDASVQERYFKTLYQRLYGNHPPWYEDYVKAILQEDIGTFQEKVLVSFSNHNKSRENQWYGVNLRPYAIEWLKRIRENIFLYKFKKIFHISCKPIITQNFIIGQAFFLIYSLRRRSKS